MVKILFTLVFCVSTAGYAADESIYAFPVNNGNKLRSDFWRPLGSMALPGLSQWMGRQFVYAGIYTGVGAVGMSVAAEGMRDGGDYEDFTSDDDGFRKALLGDAMFKVAGGISSFHAFRSAVITRRESGQYQFLPKEVETPLELALAPFDFTYALRPTTFIPLLLLMGLEAALQNSDRDGWDWSRIDGGDALLTAGVSYGAGVGEEAMFRGFLLPYMTEYTGRFWAGNWSQAAIFGAVHYSERNRFPIAQALCGAYLGWLMKLRGWQMGEGIFLHAWWDVVAIAGEFATTGEVNTISLPRFEYTF